MKMKKTIIAVAGLAMAVVLTGCGGSPKGVAEKFADAVIKRDAEKAVKLTLVSRVGSENDDKLEAETLREVITVPSPDSSYKIVNGVKVTRDEAEVVVQFVKGKDKTDKGLEVDLTKVDGSWVVVSFSSKSNLDK